MEFENWYKTIINPSRGVWIGDGITTQFTLKSTLSARTLSMRLDNSFGYFIDGSTTALFKAITEEGEQDIYEAL